MPKTGQIFKVSIIIVIIIFIVIFAVYLIFKIDNQGLVYLVGAGITGAIGLFIAVFQILNKRDSEETKEEIILIKEDVKALKGKVNNNFLSFQEQNLAFENAIIDIKSGLAEKEEAEYYVYEHVKHKNEIIDLCKTIDYNTFNKLQKEPDLNKDLERLIVEINENFSSLIIVQYESGFDKFEPNYFKTKMLNSIDLSLNNSDLNQPIKNDIEREIIKNVDSYINSISLILASQNNGVRRNKFIEKTLSHSRITTDKILNTYNKKQAV